jgi:hypothetical protein
MFTAPQSGELQCVIPIPRPQERQFKKRSSLLGRVEIWKLPTGWKRLRRIWAPVAGRNTYPHVCITMEIQPWRASIAGNKLAQGQVSAPKEPPRQAWSAKTLAAAVSSPRSSVLSATAHGDDSAGDLIEIELRPDSADILGGLRHAIDQATGLTLTQGLCAGLAHG